MKLLPDKSALQREAKEQCHRTRALLSDAYRGRPVLVVGADGFLGSHCTRELCALGANVSIFSRRAFPRSLAFRGRVVKGDLREFESVRGAIAGHEVVIDFAGGLSPMHSEHSIEGRVEDEFLAKCNLVRACAESSKMPRLLFCSSRLVYGQPCYTPVDEDHPLRPACPYAVQKLRVERCLKNFARSHGLWYCVLRMSGAYGPFAGGQPGQGVINRFLQAAVEGRPITVFGDGAQRRDFIHATDAIAATLHSATTERCKNQVINVGGREWVSISEAARMISTLAGGIPIEHVPWPDDTRHLDAADYRADLRKLDALLAMPRALTFKEGISTTLLHLRRAALSPR